jgi:Flp pilus assembly protein TadG
MTVEAALVLPMFIVFVAGAFDVGRLHLIRHTVDNAAYEAAKLATSHGATKEQVTARAEEVLDLLGTKGTEVTITPPDFDTSTPSITVQIKVPIRDNSWIIRTPDGHVGGECSIQNQARSRIVADTALSSDSL